MTSGAKENLKSAEELLAAVKRGDAAAAGALLAGGASPDGRDPRTGLTLLMTAAGLGNAAMVKKLLEHGADVHRLDSAAGASALHKACQSGSLETVKLLVEAGSFVNLQAAHTGHTPLIDAIWYMQPEIAGYLLSAGTGLNLSTSYGFTLHQHVEYALKFSSLGKEKFMKVHEHVKARQEADRRSLEGNKLLAAVLAKDLAAVRQAIKDGADLEARAPIMNNFDDGYTPLLIAAREGQAEIVRELLAAGADANATDPVFQAVPLHKATYHGHLAVTELLAAHPGIDLNFQGASNGYTPLHDALWHGYDACAKVLIDAGADLNVRAHDGTDALDIAVNILGKDHGIVRYIRARTGR